MIRFDFNTKRDIVDDIEAFGKQITIKDQMNQELLIKSKKLRNYLNIVKTGNIDLYALLLRRQIMYEKNYINFYDVIMELKLFYHAYI
jgi:hypothetical protein